MNAKDIAGRKEQSVFRERRIGFIVPEYALPLPGYARGEPLN